jgi:phenylalanyl-tRNA synthetase alpha subunit
MAIELTELEKANLKRKQKLEEAMSDWRKQVATTIAEKKISKRGISNKAKVKEVKKKAKHSANRLINCFEKGWQF